MITKETFLSVPIRRKIILSGNRPLHSWCRYKGNKANNTKLYKPGHGLSENVVALIKPIYIKRSTDSFLSKFLDAMIFIFMCLHNILEHTFLDGKTQNQNESLIGMIWNRLPKSTFSSFG